MTPAATRTGAAWAMIIVVAAGLWVVDHFLERVDASEVRTSAQRSYGIGSKLLEEDKAEQAIDPLREAHAQERSNNEYELQLAAALANTGRTTEAEPLLTEVLQRDPNDGRANLITARLMERKGDTSDAEAYYHRAIYGEWPSDTAARRDEARLELVKLLAGRDQKQELLAELISFEAESPANPDIQKRLAELFLVAGSPARAADVYEAMVNRNPDDASGYEGLGEADLEQGQYAAARRAFERASALQPDNASVRSRMETLNTVTQLDPTPRQLTSAEKYRRSILILKMASTTLGSCAAASSPENQQKLKTADALISGRTPAHVTNEVAESVLSLAAAIWRAETNCKGGPDRSALDLLMRKAAS